MKLTRNAGEEVLPLIERAEGEVTVYSPFVSPKYAKLLLEKSKDGTDVNLFTANTDANYHQKSLRILQNGPELPKALRNAGLLLIFLGMIGALIAWSLELLALVPSVLTLAGGGYLLKRHSERAAGWSEPRGKVEVHIVEDLHAKVYSRDNGKETVFGSMNFTQSGMRRNLEVIGGAPNKQSPRGDKLGKMYA